MSQRDCRMVFGKFMKLHDEAYKVIEQAKRLSVSGEEKKAIEKYEDAYRILNEALNIQYPLEDVSGKRVRKMKNKMKIVKEQVLSRLKTFVSSPSEVRSNGLDVSLRNLQLDTNNKADCILYTHPNAQIYFIYSDGNVNTYLNSDTLQVVQYEGGKRFCLHVGIWQKNLECGTSFWLRTEENTFIFHEPHSQNKGDAVGLTLRTMRYESDSVECHLLYKVLSEIVKPIRPPLTDNHCRVLTDNHGRVTFNNSDSIISEAIVRGADFLSQNMIHGALKVGELLNAGTPALINTIPPKRVQKESDVYSDIQAGLQLARNVTGAAATVTDALVGNIGTTTPKLGRYLAPHIQRVGTRFLTECFDISELEAADSVENILELTASAAEGIGVLFSGFQSAARVLGDSLATNAVKIVEHKYGSSAAAATDDAIRTVGNSLITYQNMNILFPKTSAKEKKSSVGINAKE